ncbi:MAG TPA: type II secretion system protein [Synergistales bacterium]|nr:type II secretion system protein [Synergistales bacterium]
MLTRKRGFTLIEVLLVAVILATLALILSPEWVLDLSSPQLKLQRALGELSEIASTGDRVRLRIDTREELKAERLVISQDDEGLIWQEMEIRWLSFEGEWRSEVAECHFFPDGSCTPWNLLFLSDSREFPFTVTVTCTVYEGRL